MQLDIHADREWIGTVAQLVLAAHDVCGIRLPTMLDTRRPEFDSKVAEIIDFLKKVEVN